MNNKIQDLIDISRYYGANIEYVIAGGGNTSYKNNDFLWIKASGVALANISAEGFVCMDRQKLKIISEKKYSTHAAKRESEVKEDLLQAIVENSGLRPSVETSLHELINFPFVIHTHPTLVNALLCSKQARKKAFELFGEDILFIPYIDPGYILFKYVEESLNTYRKQKAKDPKIILLENHGIFVSGESIEEVKGRYASIEKIILKSANRLLPALIEDAFPFSFREIINELYGENIELITANSILINEFVKDAAAFQEIQTAFTPDHIVYCKARYFFVDDTADDIKAELLKFKDQFGYLPKVVGIKGQGLLLLDDSPAGVEIVFELILNMLKISFYSRSFGGSKPMTNEQIAFIENWEAENYRKKMSQK